MVYALVVLAASAPAQTKDEEFVRWASERAIPVSTVDAGGDFTDMLPLKAVVGSARVVALGEPTHGAHEPLAFRNRLIRFLVEQMGFTAVALESGFTESWRVQSFLAGGNGELSAVAGNGLTAPTLPRFGENPELIDWMKQYNEDQAHRRKIRFYGIDLTGWRADKGDFSNARLSVDFAVAFLSRAGAGAADKLRAALEPMLSKFTDQQYNSLSKADHDRLEAGLSDLAAAVTRNRTELIAMTSPDEYDWVLHGIQVARQLGRFFLVAPPSADPHRGIPPGAGPAMTARDSAMAENVGWALEHEGAGGKLIVFAHDGHVMNSKADGGLWAAVREKPSMMGTFLRSMFGRDLVSIGTIGASTVGAGLPQPEPLPDSVDSVLAKVGMPSFILDLRLARDNAQVLAWLSETRPLRSNLITHVSITPATAFDALFFVDELTRTHAPKR
jgi:erythromycin esterase